MKILSPFAINSFLLTSLAAFSSSGAFADPQCTEASKDSWQNGEAFKAQLVDNGYQIKTFKVTKTSCYEIYGTDKDGQKVEIYFNPVDGSVIRQKTKS